ncbi:MULTISPECIES: DUF2537 domain-containing protein [Actinoalloteichus]|uniref:DUF2537 family protein n=1 Tax=Actinoalloteichus fjordicus TaxID=1612552 RepID=A0AAC9PV75_9PSEU|nr:MULTISPECIES: DUF2537 domain-containing protein [Actinoalloteichus]APU17661.1 putative DUF2537 family protein [Actinoalloteichus fjordicus]APU23737.1 putative DUF2537 family protein [Actinoalloteichus sp. GBA129-24]
MELRVRTGRPVLSRRPASAGEEERCPPDLSALPPGLRAALTEWAAVAESVADTEAAEGTLGSAVSDRGRRLAGLLATVTDSDVVYLDPIREVQVRIRPPDKRADSLARQARGRSACGESTPWATGLTVSAVVAIIVTITLTTVSVGWAETAALFAAGVNLVVVGGLVPAMWLLRRTPVWRWIVYGAAAGVLLSWTGLLIAALAALG